MARQFINIETEGIKPLLILMNRTPKRIARSMRLAANTALREANTKMRGGLAAEIDIDQKQIKNRLRYTPAPKTTEARYASLWVGMQPIKARRRYWGRLRQDVGGSWAKKYYFQGAFVASLSRQKGPSIYKRIGRERFPVRLQQVEFDTSGTRRVIARVTKKAREKYISEVVRLSRVDWSKPARNRGGNR